MSKKIRICFVQAFAYAVFNPESSAKIGGAEVDLYNIAKELVKDERFDVYFLVADFGQEELEIYDNIKVVKGHSQEKSMLNYFTAFLKFYKKLVKINADIYFTANLSKYVGFTNLYCKLARKIHIHRTEHQHQVNRKKLLKHVFKGESRYILFLLGYINVNHIVVQNEEDRVMLKKTFNYPSNVIRNSYPIKRLNNKNRKFILWVARSEKWKQPEIFIKLAKAFPTEKFVMIMPMANDPIYFRKIKNKAMKLNNLRFIPGVPFSEVEEFYQNAKLFINTSSAEGFPNSFNQAMNSSTPIISFNINPDNFVNKNKVGIYCNNDFDVLKESIEKLLNNQQLWQELSENAYNYVNNEMNIEKAIIKWKKIFFYLYKRKTNSI